MDPLKRLRLRLTAWYVGTFTVLLVLLGSGLFIALSGQLSGDLDLRLETAVAAVRRTMDVRAAFGTAPEQALREAVAENAGPERLLYLFDRAGQPLIAPKPVDPRIAAAAMDAVSQEDAVSDEFRTSSRQRWRLYAEPILLGDGRGYALVALADATGFERQFSRLLQTFIAAALLALLPVGLGGYQIARVSAASVERAMERLRMLTADAAHELRTPVSVIRGHAELAIQRERDPAAYSAALQHIASEAQRLGQLLDNLLVLARAEAGERPQERRLLFLDDLADEAVTRAAVLGAERGVAVTLGRFEETPVLADPELLRQLLMILLDNGIKFTPSGGSVQVHTFTEGHRAVLAVEDTGIGIAPEHLAHVFQRFYRGDRARSRVPGAGLGLAIARWIADQHDAAISISSIPDRGTRVEVRFPIPPGRPPEQPAAAPAPSSST